MVTPSSPFSFLDDFINRVGSRLQPPGWVIHEVQHRAVLFLNHVLQQDPASILQRLARQQGRVVEFEWRFVTMKVVATPAGLLDLAPEDATPELMLVLAETSPFGLARAAVRGARAELPWSTTSSWWRRVVGW